MHYIDLVRKAPNKSESTMWESVEHVSHLVDELWHCHESMARKFIMSEYVRLYGNHFEESMARCVVDEMYHYLDGKRVDGEVVTKEEARQYAPSEETCWDAYVGLNGFVHDLVSTDMPKSSVMSIARAFWFEDDDFDGESKVLWYYASK